MPTKRANGEGSIRKVVRNGKTYWEARFCVDVSGYTERKSVYGLTQAEARKKMQAALNAINESNYFEPTRITYEEWLDEWIKTFCKDVKPATLKKYSADIRLHIKPALGKIKLRDLKSIHIQRFLNSMADAGKSPKSIRCIQGVLSGSLKEAVKQEYIPKNPASADYITLPKLTQKKIVPLTDAQIKLFMAESAGNECEYALKLILFTGLREAECAGLTWDAVDFKENRITIDKQLRWRSKADGGNVYASVKNGKERILTVPQFVVDELRAVERQQKLDRLAAGEIWQGWKSEAERKKAPVFLRADGTVIDAPLLYREYKKIAKKIGAPDSCVHDLRHSYATLSLQNGDDIKTLQSNLGHATSAFTLDRYGHTSERMQKNSAERMQEYIENIG